MNPVVMRDKFWLCTMTQTDPLQHLADLINTWLQHLGFLLS